VKGNEVRWARQSSPAAQTVDKSGQGEGAMTLKCARTCKKTEKKVLQKNHCHEVDNC